MIVKEVFLYIDDIGSRDPDRIVNIQRNDKMDCFALGGFLVNAEDVEAVKAAHADFCHKHNIDYPLHSWAIRGGRNRFSWLRAKSDKTTKFYDDINDFLSVLPVVGIASVIHRPGYVARYKAKYGDNLWSLCRPAYSILIERAAKHAQKNNRKLRIYFEETGKKEDKAIIAYTKNLKQTGMPFNQGNSVSYVPMRAAELEGIILGEPKRQKKENIMIQIADLMLYPMAKAKYEPEYKPYKLLVQAGKIIDSVLSEDEVKIFGVKYSCFDYNK